MSAHGRHGPWQWQEISFGHDRVALLVGSQVQLHARLPPGLYQWKQRHATTGEIEDDDGKIIARSDKNCEDIDMSASKRQHLYLVLEDWEHGYTIRKIDVESFDAADDAAAAKDPEALPEPPVIRVEADHSQPAFFPALGTKILALQPSAGAAALPVFDAATMGLAVAPQPQGDALARRPTLVAVGSDRIYGLEGVRVKSPSGGEREVRHFEVLRAPAPPGTKLWSWSSVPAPPPFDPGCVTCHAAHPDGRTVFFSAAAASGASSKVGSGGGGTFSFNTQRLEWTCHGAWMLPFAGQAHYDAKLDAWVGIYAGDTDNAGGDAAARGRVCSCAVVAPGRRRMPAPETKVCAEALFCEDEKRHAGAALVHMGDGGRFCVLECVKPKPKPAAAKATTKKVWKEKQPEISNGHHLPDSPEHLLLVTAFVLEYGDQGELAAAATRRLSYVVPEEAAKFLEKPVAFWM
ncbi:unnamed protein product [Urochloa decumbens]|uniref:Uncharacterized protein n=1 Tax=Urochloa decumbens TaxID=240449 RepID=A0ABC9AF10_9POAL